MPIPAATGRQDYWTGTILPKNLGTWANLEATREITISNVAVSNYVGNIIVGNVGFGNLTIPGSTITANANVITLTTTTANIANISVGMRVYSANVAANTTVTSIRNSSVGNNWNNWNNWSNQAETYFIWNSDIIDLLDVQTFNLLINTESTGNIVYTVYSSTTGAFDGTETVTTINPMATDITAYTAQYVVVSANVQYQSNDLSLTSMDITTTNEQITIAKGAIDSSTLAGTTESRELDLGRNVSYIYSLQMTPYLYSGGTGYTTSGYFTTGYIDETIVTGAFAQIIDKSNGGANIALIDNEGNYIDGTFDALVYALPEMYRDGNNIKAR